MCGTLNSLGSDDLRDIILRNEEHRHRKMPFTCLIIDEVTALLSVFVVRSDFCSGPSPIFKKYLF